MAIGDNLLGGALGPFQTIWSGLGVFAKAIAFGVPALIIVWLIIYYIVIKPKRYNLRVIFNMTRSDGRIVNAEIGKGIYNTKRGYILLKRPKTSGHIEMKPADPKKYIYGDNILQVSQIGPNTWVPIHPDSLTQYVNDKGEVEHFIDFKTDLTDQLSWADSFKRRTKDTFSIMDFLTRYQTPIALGFVLIAQGISTAFIVAVIR